MNFNYSMCNKHPLFYFQCLDGRERGECEVYVEEIVTLLVGYINGLPNRARQFNLQYDKKSERRMEEGREGRRVGGKK